jgi:hypothetical protein
MLKILVLLIKAIFLLGTHFFINFKIDVINVKDIMFYCFYII